jgi:hypothetical protein
VGDRGSAVFDPYELLGALQGRDVSFVVIGAFARVIRGTRELTDGIDIAPSMREANLTRLEAALEDLDARRADGAPLDVRELGEPVVELETRAGELKIVPEPAGTRGYDDLRRAALTVEIAGTKVTVAALADVVRSKQAAARPKDLLALPVLRRLLEEE